MKSRIRRELERAMVITPQGRVALMQLAVLSVATVAGQGPVHSAALPPLDPDPPPTNDSILIGPEQRQPRQTDGCDYPTTPEHARTYATSMGFNLGSSDYPFGGSCTERRAECGGAPCYVCGLTARNCPGHSQHSNAYFGWGGSQEQMLGTVYGTQQDCPLYRPVAPCHDHGAQSTQIDLPQPDLVSLSLVRGGGGGGEGVSSSDARICMLCPRHGMMLYSVD